MVIFLQGNAICLKKSPYTIYTYASVNKYKSGSIVVYFFREKNAQCNDLEVNIFNNIKV